MANKKPKSATVNRSAMTGRFVVREDGGPATTHQVKPKSAAVIRESVAKNRDALQRLANR